jgi:arginine exporter protein ArgO
MSFFIEGLTAGYGIAIPVGAVAVLIINVGMRCGFRVGFSAGAGAAAADFMYATIAVLAGTAVAGLLEPIASYLQIVSGLILIAIGSWGIGHGLKHANTTSRSAEVCGPVRMFGQFLGITIVNPLTIVYFVALIIGRDSTSLTLSDRVAFVIGVGMASLSWQTLLAGIGTAGHRKLPPRFQVVAIISGNIVVIGLGLRVLAALAAA